MLWLQPQPWLRWALAGVVALVVVYVELRPDPTVGHPFAVRPILTGETLDATNTEIRRLPRGLFDPVPPGAVASRVIPPGAPVLPQDVGAIASVVPEGWWVVSVPLPPSARAGGRVRLVVIDSGQVVDGVVVEAGGMDTFGGATGGVAIPGQHAVAVARAAIDGRVAVLVSAG
jgi:hypothetical protein